MLSLVLIQRKACMPYLESCNDVNTEANVKVRSNLAGHARESILSPGKTYAEINSA